MAASHANVRSAFSPTRGRDRTLLSVPGVDPLTRKVGRECRPDRAVVRTRGKNSRPATRPSGSDGSRRRVGRPVQASREEDELEQEGDDDGAVPEVQHLEVGFHIG